jgi:putative flippase GtrA
MFSDWLQNMQAVAHKLVPRKKMTTFGLIGLAIFVMGGIILNLLVFLGFSPQVANLIQAVISVESNFFLNNALTWRDRRSASLLRRWWRYHLGKVFITIPLNQVFFEIGYQVSGSTTVAYVIATGLITLFNYFLNEFFVFRKEQGTSTPK